MHGYVTTLVIIDQKRASFNELDSYQLKTVHVWRNTGLLNRLLYIIINSISNIFNKYLSWKKLWNSENQYFEK